MVTRSTNLQIPYWTPDLPHGPDAYNEMVALIDAISILASGNIQAALDSIGATRGSLLYRGASGWAIIPPGTANYLLTSSGSGADPTWAAPPSTGANTALSNLASVAINTTLASDTNNTDDLGTSAIMWRTGYFMTGIEIGHASDSTLARLSAGNLGIEGNLIYRAGGTDVPITDGGTGASTAANARTNLGLGTAATANTGTSGTAVPLLDAATNTFSGRVKADRFGAGNKVTIADAAVGSIEWDPQGVGSATGCALIYSNSNTGPTVPTGFWRVRAGATPAMTELFKASGTHVAIKAAGGALDGTTALDGGGSSAGYFLMSPGNGTAGDSLLYFQNRTGSSKTIYIVIFEVP